jgi:hypothetical protein
VQIGFLELVAAIFAGTSLTCAFVWGMNQASKVTDPRDLDWLAYAAVLMPVFFFIAALYTTGSLPQGLASAAPR